MIKFFTSMVVSGSLLGAAVPALAEAPTGICGSKPDMVDIMLRMAEDGVERIYSDNKLFVMRDSRDESSWVISLPNTTAHPAAACRTKANDVVLLCAAGEKPCASFKEQAIARLEKVAAEKK